MRLEDKTQRFYLARNYSEALQGLGALPVHISLIPQKKYIKNLLNDLDGILLPGSDNDIDPLKFGEEPHQKLGRVVPLKDETDEMVLSEVESLKLPILGICYGMQALNVFRGGTLFQDVNSQIPASYKHSQGIPLERNSHSVKIEKNSLLSKLAGKQKVTVNSHHHQSVKETGKNLKVTGRAKDGVIECIEDTRKERFALGVQWHPELSWDFDDLSFSIFKVFVEEACKYSDKRNS